jgi:hypothetical protein
MAIGLFCVAVSGMTGWKVIVSSFEIHVNQYLSTGSNIYQYVSTRQCNKRA